MGKTDSIRWSWRGFRLVTVVDVGQDVKEQWWKVRPTTTTDDDEDGYKRGEGDRWVSESERVSSISRQDCNCYVLKYARPRFCFFTSYVSQKFLLWRKDDRGETEKTDESVVVCLRPDVEWDRVRWCSNDGRLHNLTQIQNVHCLLWKEEENKKWHFYATREGEESYSDLAHWGLKKSTGSRKEFCFRTHTYYTKTNPTQIACLLWESTTNVTQELEIQKEGKEKKIHQLTWKKRKVISRREATWWELDWDERTDGLRNKLKDSQLLVM